MEENNKIRKNIGWLFSGQTVGRTLRTLVLIYAARALGVAGWGAVSYALSILTFFTVFSDIGINALITRQINQSPEEKERYISTAFYIKLFIISIVAIVSIFLARFITNIDEVVKLMPLVAIIVAFDTLRDLGVAVARGIEKMKIEGLNNILTNAVIAGVGFAALLIYPSGENLMLAYILGTGIGLANIIFALRKEISRILTKFNRALVGKIFSLSWPFGIMGLMGIIMINTDVIIIGWLRSVEEVGLYSAGQKIVQLLYLAPTLIATAFFPALAKSTKVAEKFKSLFEEALSIIFMLAIPLSIGGVILSAEIIDILFGPEYIGSVPAFIVLMMTTVIVFPSVLIANAIFAHDKQKSFLIYVLFGIAGNIALDLMLIPILGILGSALATLVNQLLINTYLWIRMKKISEFKIINRVNKIVISAIVMGVSSYFVNLAGIHVLINVALSGAVYFGVLYLLKDKALRDLMGLR